MHPLVLPMAGRILVNSVPAAALPHFIFTLHYGCSFSTRLLSSCTDEYAHTYDISTYSLQQCELLWLGLGLLGSPYVLPGAVHTHHICNMQMPCKKRVNHIRAVLLFPFSRIPKMLGTKIPRLTSAKK